MNAVLLLEISHLMSGSRFFQKSVFSTGKPPSEKVLEKASRSIPWSQSRSRTAIHCRSRAFA
jgi:hypothetical protein